MGVCICIVVDRYFGKAPSSVGRRLLRTSSLSLPSSPPSSLLLSSSEVLVCKLWHILTFLSEKNCLWIFSLLLPAINPEMQLKVVKIAHQKNSEAWAINAHKSPLRSAQCNWASLQGCQMLTSWNAQSESHCLSSPQTILTTSLALSST